MGYFPGSDNPEFNHLKILFSPFTDGADIINLFKESQGAYFSLGYYDSLGESGYLTLCHMHIKRILMEQAKFLGKVYRAKSNWTDLDNNLFRHVVTNSREMINSELSRLKQEMPEEIRDIDLDIISKITRNNLDFFTSIEYEIKSRFIFIKQFFMNDQ
jgi:hypothetical protein